MFAAADSLDVHYLGKWYMCLFAKYIWQIFKWTYFSPDYKSV